MIGRTRVKICGITRPEDALAAAELGADAIGIVRYDASPRGVSVEGAAAIVQVLPPFVTPVLLYVDAEVEQINAEADRLGIRQVQLQGNEPPQVLGRLSPGLRAIKAVRVRMDLLADDLDTWRGRDADRLAGILLETAGVVGGSGVENDYPAIADAKRKGLFDGMPPILVAGGLTTQNVGGVIRAIRPWAVDVSSGVEASPGVKSRDKLVAFLTAVREADAV